MRLLFLPLALLLIVAVFSQFIAVGKVDVRSNASFGFQNATYEQDSNSSEIGGQSISAGFDMSYGVLAFVIAVMAVGVVAGINVLGSGLNQQSVRVIYKSVAFFGLWALISSFALLPLTSIPVFGWLLYFGLTLAYGVGVMESV